VLGRSTPAIVFVDGVRSELTITRNFIADLTTRWGLTLSDTNKLLFAMDSAGNIVIAPEHQHLKHTGTVEEKKICHGDLICGSTPVTRPARDTTPMHGEHHHSGHFRGVARQGGEIHATTAHEGKHRLVINNKSGFSLARVLLDHMETALGSGLALDQIKKHFKKSNAPNISLHEIQGLLCYLNFLGFRVPMTSTDVLTGAETPFVCPGATPPSGGDTITIMIFSEASKAAYKAARAAKAKAEEEHKAPAPHPTTPGAAAVPHDATPHATAHDVRSSLPTTATPHGVVTSTSTHKV
jgi:hypothetical protein